MNRTVTLFDLVVAIADEATSDAEAVATVAHLVNAGIVRLRGDYRGARVDLRMPGPITV